MNGVWIGTIPYCLKSTELYQEELWDNLHLRYGLMPRNIPATYDGAGKKLLINHVLYLPEDGLVLAQHY